MKEDNSDKIKKPRQIFELGESDKTKGRIGRARMSLRTKFEDRMNTLLVPKKTSALSKKTRTEIQ